jgi:hypothetical protein
MLGRDNLVFTKNAGKSLDYIGLGLGLKRKKWVALVQKQD